ncbi:MAG: rhomboid family intramembrane serine protease [Bacteroidia bacterium]
MVKHILIWNVLVYVAVLLPSKLSGLIVNFFPLHKAPSGEFRLYQVLTYFFTHFSFFHIFANMWVLWSLGSAVERVLGEKKFLWLYFFTGIGSGLVLAYVDTSSIPVIGASTAVSGVFSAFAFLFPDAHLIIFPIPIPIKARNLLLGYAGLSLILALWRPNVGGISHLGHLSGVVLGYLWMRFLR